MHYIATYSTGVLQLQSTMQYQGEQYSLYTL